MRFRTAAMLVFLAMLLALVGSRRIRQADVPGAPADATEPVALQFCAPDLPFAEPLPVPPPATSDPVHHQGCGEGCVAESIPAASIRWFVSNQNADGSWGSDAEVFEGRIHTPASATALALLAITSFGYSHLSRDQVEGRSVGAAVKAALKWMFAREPADAWEASLLALSLGESYGLTNSQIIRHYAQEAVDRLAGFERFDATSVDPQAEAWAAAALRSARESGLEFDAAVAERLAGRLVRPCGGSPELFTARLLVDPDREDPSLAAASAAFAAALPDAASPDMTRWFFTTFGLYLAEGPGNDREAGEHWKAWQLPLRDALASTQQKDGSWPGIEGPTGRTVKTAMATLSLEVYYRYSGMIGVR